MMQVEIEESGQFIRKLSVTVPAEDVTRELDLAYRRVAKAAKIPGFRPGKVPRGVLKMHYGEQIVAEVNNTLVQQSLPKAMSDHSVAPVTTPKVVPGKVASGSAFEYTAEVEIQPEIKVERYEGLDVPTFDVVVADEEIDAEVTRLQEQAAQVVPVDGRDVVETGDLVQIDYQGTLDGVAFDGGTAENATLEIGSGTYLKGFEEALTGQTVPGETSFPVDFPEDYGAPHLAGKQAMFTVQLKELKTKELPAIDDEFAKDLEHDSLDAMRASITGDIQKRKEDGVRADEREAALKALVSANPFEVAPSMIEEQLDRMVQGAAAQMAQMMGTQHNFSDTEMQELRNDSRERADHQVRSGLLLMEVTKAVGIEVSKEDVQGEIDAMIERGGPQSAGYINQHYQNPDERMRLHYKLLEDRTVDLILEKANRVPAAEKADDK